MKNFFNKKLNNQFKETISSFYRSFLTIDKRMRKNIVIVTSMILIVIITGVFVAMVKLFQMGESLIESHLASHKETSLITKLDNI